MKRLLLKIFRFEEKVKGQELIFISQIHRKGTGVSEFGLDADMSHLDNDYFNVNCLSITQGTYIASGFNSYVVKYK